MNEILELYARGFYIPGVVQKLVLTEEAPQISRLERAAFVKDKGPSENGEFGVKAPPQNLGLSGGGEYILAPLKKSLGQC